MGASPVLDPLVLLFRRSLDNRPETKQGQKHQGGRGLESSGPRKGSQAQKKANLVPGILGFGGAGGQPGCTKAAAALQTSREGRAWRAKLEEGGAGGRDKAEAVPSSRGRWCSRNPSRQPTESLPTLQRVWSLPRLEHDAGAGKKRHPLIRPGRPGTTWHKGPSVVS